MSAAVLELDQVGAAAKALAAAIAGRGAEIEAAGRLPADIVAALRESGIYRLWMPRELGGLEADPSAVLAVVATLAEADGSVGWCAATGIASNTATAFFPESTARALFGEADQVLAGALMPAGRAVRLPDGRYRLSGRWSFGSGTEHSDWLVGGAIVDGPDGASARALLMPVGSVRFIDTWQVIGLEGTGSVDYEVSGLEIPAEHTVELAALSAWPAGSMWRIALRSLLYPLLGAVSLGIARRAVAELSELAAARIRSGSSRPLAEQQVVQATMGQAVALVEAGAAFLDASLRALFDSAAQGGSPPDELRARARLAGVHASENAASAVQLCYRAAGTSALYRSSPLQRALRDVNAATQHFALSSQGYQLAGEVLFGFAPHPAL